MKHDVIVPSPGESITEVFIGTWLKKSGDTVRKGEVLVDLETQKATVELEATHSGRLEILAANSGQKVKVGDVIATIDSDGAAAEKARPSEAAAKAPAPAESQTQMGPAARKLAAERGVDTKAIAGSGKGGRILKEDVLREEVPRPAPVSPAAAAPSQLSAENPPRKSIPADVYTVNTARGDHLVPATRLRRQIAENLVRAQHTAAILTTFNEVDMSLVLSYRKSNKDAFQKEHGVSPGMVGFFAMAAVQALKLFPAVNAYFTGEDIIYHDYVDLSVAVSTERGLVVPVVRDLDKLDFIGFEKALAGLSEKAKLGKLSIPEMTGGTFTITNGGVFGSLLSTPLLNMPQSAILGLHKIEERPVAVEGKIVVKPMMYLALSYDHRIIDGREAVQFLVKVKEQVERLDFMGDK